jgi:hypothetical protein
MAPTWIETDSNTNKDISSAASVGVYTSTGDKFVMPQLLADQVAGNGDYVYYVTLQVNGAGSHYVIGPKTTHAAASGETAIGAQGGFIAVRSGDVLTVYIDGLAGDTATPDVTVRWFELAASPTAAANATAAAAAILVTPANKLATNVNGVATANMTLWKGATAPDLTGDAFAQAYVATEFASDARSFSSKVANLVQGGGEAGPLQFSAEALALAPGVAAQDVADALLLAPSAGDPAAGSAMALLTGIDANVDAVKLTTDALDVTAVTQVAASSAGHLTITAGLTFSEAVTGLTIPADWEVAIWTLKHNEHQADTAARIQLRTENPAAVTDGLQRINGAAPETPITAADGTLTVTQASGRIDIWLSDELTALLSKATGLGWDVKFIDDADDSTGRRGTADVVLTETRAVA